MVKVTVTYQKDEIIEMLIQGHANYEEKGKDIVCAAVSSIVITSVNGIMRLKKDSLDFHETDAEINIKIKQQDEITKTLIFNMFVLLDELANQYPQNIVIRRCQND